LRLSLGGDPLEFGDEIWRQKTRVLGLTDGEEIMKLAFFVLTQYRRVTDGQTDGQTRCDRYYQFDENSDENLSAVVHFQCRIFKRFNIKAQNN